MEALQAFKEASHIVPKRELEHELLVTKNELDHEIEILGKQLDFLTNDMERLQIITPGAVGEIDHKREQIALVKSKILERQGKINDLYLRPFAQAVLNEASAEIGKLSEEADSLWREAIEARVEFLKKLTQLGELRRKSQEICWSVTGACQTLCRHPLDNAIKYSGQHQMEVKLSYINELLWV